MSAQDIAKAPDSEGKHDSVVELEPKMFERTNVPTQSNWWDEDRNDKDEVKPKGTKCKFAKPIQANCWCRIANKPSQLSMELSALWLSSWCLCSSLSLVASFVCVQDKNLQV